MTQTFSALMRLNKMNKMMRSMERHQEMAARARFSSPEDMMAKMKEAIAGLLGVNPDDVKASFNPDDLHHDDGPPRLPDFDLRNIMNKGTKGH